MELRPRNELVSSETWRSGILVAEPVTIASIWLNMRSDVRVEGALVAKTGSHRVIQTSQTLCREGKSAAKVVLFLSLLRGQ